MSLLCKVTKCLAKSMGHVNELEMGESGICKKCLTGYHLTSLRELQRLHGIDDMTMRKDLSQRLSWDMEIGKYPCVCDNFFFEEFYWHDKMSRTLRRMSEVKPEEIVRCIPADRSHRVCVGCITLCKCQAEVPGDYFFIEQGNQQPAALKFKCIEMVVEYTSKPWRGGQPPFLQCRGYTSQPHSLCHLCKGNWSKRSVDGEPTWSDMFEPNRMIKVSYQSAEFKDLVWSG